MNAGTVPKCRQDELHPISWTLKLRFEKREASEMPRRKKARYGREMRARAADLFEAGLGFELAAKKLDAPAPAVRKWLYAYRATGRKGLIGMGESRRTYDMETKLAVARCVSSRGFEQKEHRKLSSRSIGSAHAF